MKFIKILFLSIAFSFVSLTSAQEVFTTKTGTKFHKSKCHFLKYSKKTLTLKKAIALGYEACKVCKPSSVKNSSEALNFSSGSNSNAGSSSKKTSASQCTGKTKAGKRCKRKTKNSSGRCYQH